MFLESFSSDSATGKIRGAFLTASNMAWLMAPLTGSFLLGEDHYANIYVMSALLLVPAIALVYGVLKEFVDPVYSKVPFWKSANEVWTNRNLRGALVSQFLLQFFYAWMIIYAPIYLHETVGFDWPSLGIMFSIMLLPFVLIEMPLGKLADSRFGEKEILSLGFVVMAICTWLIPFITDNNFIIWTAILFAGRTGAAMVEIMADTYFFKQVNASNAHLISFSRTMRPLAYIVSPIMASILFIRFDIKILFLALGFLMVYGLRYSLSIVDTK
ncbi:MAG: MFS transporter [Candidatus Paceibacterota bacterium]|jgi:hypothetical protein